MRKCVAVLLSFWLAAAPALADPAGYAQQDLSNVSPNAVAGLIPGGGVTNAMLANSSMTLAGHVVPLGGSQSFACGDLSNAGAICTLNIGAGLSSSGGNLLIAGGAITNAMLANSSVTVNGHALALGGSLTLGFGDFSGQIACSQVPAATGDITRSAGSCAETVAKINGNACSAGFTLGTAGCYWTQTFTSAASVAWTGLTGNEYELRCANLLQSANGATNKLYIRFGEGGTPTYQSSANYAWAYDGFDSLGNIQRGGTEGDTGIAINPGWQFNIANYGLSGTWNLHNLQGAVNKQIDGIGQFAKGGSPAPRSFLAGAFSGVWYGDQNAITAIQIITPDAVTITSGYCTLYPLNS